MWKNRSIQSCLVATIVFSCCSIAVGIPVVDDFSGTTINTAIWDTTVAAGMWTQNDTMRGEWPLGNPSSSQARLPLVDSLSPGSVDYTASMDFWSHPLPPSVPGNVYGYPDGGLTVSFQDLSNFISIGVCRELTAGSDPAETSGIKIVAEARVSGSPTTIDYVIPSPELYGPDSGWHTLEVVRSGAQYMVSLDGVGVLGFSDSYWSGNGNVALYAYGDRANEDFLGDPNLGGQYYDNFSLATVPEPATITLLAIGLAGPVGMFMRRRKRR